MVTIPSLLSLCKPCVSFSLVEDEHVTRFVPHTNRPDDVFAAVRRADLPGVEWYADEWAFVCTPYGARCFLSWAQSRGYPVRAASRRGLFS